MTVKRAYTATGCTALSTEQVSGPGSLSVLVVPDCSSGLGAPKIAGIVVGSILGAALLVVLFVYLSRFVLRKAWTDALFRRDGSYRLVEGNGDEMY